MGLAKYRIPYRIVLGFYSEILVEGLPNRNFFGINSVIFLCAMGMTERESGQKTHEHKQIWGIIPGLGEWQKFVCLCFIFGGGGGGVIPFHGRENTKKNTTKSRDNPVKCLFTYFFFSGFCSLPRKAKEKTGKPEPPSPSPSQNNS